MIVGAKPFIYACIFLISCNSFNYTEYLNPSIVYVTCIEEAQ